MENFRGHLMPGAVALLSIQQSAIQL